MTLHMFRHSASGRWRFSPLGLAPIAAAALLLAGCGGQTRSAAAYCSYFYGEGSTLRNRYIQADQNFKRDPLQTIATLLASPGDLASFFHQLSLRAPEDIAPDVERMSDAFQKEADTEGDALSDPLGALGSGLINGLTTLPAEERVNAFTEQNCGPPPAGASS
jgi:hypothetical protein